MLVSGHSLPTKHVRALLDGSCEGPVVDPSCSRVSSLSSFLSQAPSLETPKTEEEVGVQEGKTEPGTPNALGENVEEKQRSARNLHRNTHTCTHTSE